MPEEQLWYVRYGAIAGGPLEKHIHIVGLRGAKEDVVDLLI